MPDMEKIKLEQGAFRVRPLTTVINATKDLFLVEFFGPKDGCLFERVYSRQELKTIWEAMGIVIGSGALLEGLTKLTGGQINE